MTVQQGKPFSQTFSVSFGVQNQQIECSDWQTLFRTRDNLTLTSAVYLWNMPPHNQLILYPLLIVTGFCMHPEHSPCTHEVKRYAALSH
jgi:hypothetical protein